MNYNSGDLYSRNRKQTTTTTNTTNNNNNTIINNNDITNNYNDNGSLIFNKQHHNQQQQQQQQQYNHSSYIKNNVILPIFIHNLINSINNNKWVIIVSKIYKQTTSNPKFRKIFLLVQVLILFLLLQHTLNKFQRTDDSDSTLIKYRNNLCQDNNINHHGGYLDVFKKSTTSTSSSLLLNQHQQNIDLNLLCSKEFEFQKFIWIFVDSLAHDQANDIIEQFKENANVYRVLNHGFKFSTAIYTTFFTGKIPTNYAGKPIQSDNIFYQLKKAGNSMHFVGPEFPAPTLLADSPTQHRYFDQFTIVPDETSLFTQLFTSNGDHTASVAGASQDSVSSRLDILSEGGKKSVMLTTNLLDDKIHRNGKTHPPTLRLLDALTKNIPLLKKWLSEHPEYLLILNSDHGGSKTGGVNEGDLHGAKDGGNEGFFMFYNKNQIIKKSTSYIPTMHEREWLDTVDVAPTIVKYFKNANIPLESLGLVSSSLDPHYAGNQTSTYLELLQNALQIRQLCVLKRFPYSESDFERASQYGTMIANLQPTQLSEKINQLRQFIIDIKEPMVDFKKFPLQYLIWVGFLLLVVQIVNFKIEMSQNQIIQLLIDNFFPTVLPYFYIYIDFLFLKFDYHKHFINIFTLYFIIIPIIILYTINKLIIDKFLNGGGNGGNGNIGGSGNQQQQQQQHGNNSIIDEVNSEIDIISQQPQVPLQIPLIQIPMVEISIGSSSNNDIDSSSSKESTSNTILDNQPITTSTSTAATTTTTTNTLNEQYIQQIQQDYQQQLLIQQQLQFEHEMIEISNIEYEWLNTLFYNVCFVLISMVSSQYIIEFLPMVYEGFQSFSFFINYFILYYMIYIIVILKTQLLSNYISNLMVLNNGSGGGNGGGIGNNISTLLFNNPLKILGSNQSRMIFVKYGTIYFTMVTLCMLYDISSIPEIMQLCYLLMFIQVLVMVFGIYSLSDDLCIIASILVYAVSTDEQRFYLLLFYIPQLYVLSNTYNGSGGIGGGRLSIQLNSFNGKLKVLSRMIALFMIVISFKTYIFMGGQFNMNVDVRAGNVGLLNMEDYPTLSGFLMVFHKLGYFFILITFLLKYVKSDYNNNINNNNNNNNNINFNNNNNNHISIDCTTLELKSWLFRILSQKSIVLMWIFNFNFWQYKDYLDCFITTLIFSIVTVGFGFCLCLDELSKYLKPKVVKFLNK